MTENANMNSNGHTAALHSLALQVLGGLEKPADMTAAMPGPVPAAAPMQQPAPVAAQPGMPQVQPGMPMQPGAPQAGGKGGKAQSEERLANLEAAVAELLQAGGMADPEKALAAKITQQPGAQAPAAGAGGPIVAQGPLDPMGAAAMQNMKFGELISTFNKSASFQDPSEYISNLLSFLRGVRAASR